jgi:hypothetical protein
MKSRRLPRIAPVCAAFAGAVLMVASAVASPLEDSYLGLERGASQDTLGPDAGLDPFATVANPAWGARAPMLTLLYTRLTAQLEEGARAEDAATHAAVGFQAEVYGVRTTLLSVLPASPQDVIDTGNPDDSISPWMLRDRQVAFNAAFSKAFLGESLRVGVGIPLFLDAEAQANLQLSSDDARTRARMRLAPKPSYSVGLLWQPDETWELSLAYREQQTSKADVVFDAGIPLLTTDLYVEGSSEYVFAPRRASLQASKSFGAWRWGTMLRFSDWSAMSSPFIRILSSSPDLEVREPSFSARDAWDLGTGISWDFAPGRWRALASLRFQDSPFDDIRSFSDGDQWILGLGLSGRFDDERLRVHLSARVHSVAGGSFYTWTGLGLGYAL